MSLCILGNKLGLAKISHSKSSNKINIPIDIARETGMDSADQVIVVRRGKNKLEVKRYDGPESLKEYIQEDTNYSN